MPYVFNKYYPWRNLVFFFGEGILIFCTFILVNWLFKGSAIFLLDIQECLQQTLLVTITFQLCLYFFDLYELRKNIPLPEMAIRITQAFGVGCILLGIIYYILPVVTIPTMIFWSGYFILYLAVLLWRSLYVKILQKELFVQSIAIVGTGVLAEAITRELAERLDAPYKVNAFIGEREPQYNPNRIPVFRNFRDIDHLLSQHKIDRIVVALDDRRGTTPIQELLNYKLHGIAIEGGVTFYENLTAKVMAERVDPSWIIFSDGFSVTKVQQFGKRILDIIASIILLTLSLPVMLITAIIIIFESPGPVFYRQERVGMSRRSFEVIKFRSMVHDAEKDGAVWATTNDSRVTRFGLFIRKVRIDELPQLFNVLKGEMSLVGPRPERPIFVEKLKESIPFYDIRHEVRPGVTGWAQICYPYGASEEDALRKLEYDLYYLKHMSFALDIVVIFRTIKTVLFAKGGR
ncbi:MAG: TIGR03013 family PEP-CTERM/XrtA system glycosyltransferase [Desulfocapsaceae bacterium]|nr:TIGR03013 family PEP-CTERM/XrtA system glycosyltransferase [Desulfocapsaceae bacterium]